MISTAIILQGLPAHTVSLLFEFLIKFLQNSDQFFRAFFRFLSDTKFEQPQPGINPDLAALPGIFIHKTRVISITPHEHTKLAGCPPLLNTAGTAVVRSSDNR